MKRGAGVIMHIASLPGEFGIGSFGNEAYKFAEFVKKSGFKYWQILPLGHTSYGDSPYQSFSAFAGNPYFIDYDFLRDDGLLVDEDYKNENYGELDNSIDYGAIFLSKFKVLKKAFENYKKNNISQIRYGIEEFQKENDFWLKDYSLYMSLKYHFSFKSWYEWDDSIKRREATAINSYEELLKDEIEYWNFIQYLFYFQWRKLKNYVNKLGIQIIGDIPIYVAEDSVDTWSNSDSFKMDKDILEPLVVAGCPPDSFSETGQLWGNLIYDWDKMKKDNYKWWKMRIKESLKLYDIVRIDHFRGFESYWEIPYKDKTAVNGRWIKGPGKEFFEDIKRDIGEVNIIAEDLGYLTDEVRLFLKDTGFPGMRVLQFAFDGANNNNYLPHRYSKNCVAYTGTHDNDTFLGWYETSGSDREVINAKKYLALNKEEGYSWGFIRGVWSSIADVAIAPMQDFLNLGNDSRMNLPSTLGANWGWRVEKNSLSNDLANKIYEITKIYGRCD
ncbi:4-alpha-glucanotransferase [Clostridium paraputrificum]|uniref:4-alpha-glucanotransferase n=1 Tax=Clostridium TaxID=1485 RepID=UPI003D32648B